VVAASEPARKAEATPETTLIAGVGHRFWGDRSTGPVWVDRMAALDWPEQVVLDDYSFGAIAMTQQLQAQPHARAVFVTAEQRDRPAATLYLDRHLSRDATPEHVQACVAEAGGGVVAIDLLLVIAEHFKALPAETWVLEIEPADADWGDGLSPRVEALYPQALDMVRALVAGWAGQQAAGVC